MDAAFSRNRLMQTIIKRILILSACVAGIIIAFLILLSLVIQTPPVQQYIIRQVTLFVSNKTLGKVSITRAGITFPESVSIDGLFVADPGKDTVVYAGTVRANIDLIGLIFGKVHVRSVSLKNVSGFISRAQNDSLFNYQFLLSAFANPGKKTSKGRPAYGFIVDKIDLENIRFNYDDRFLGIRVKAGLNRLHMDVNKTNMAESGFDIDKLALDGASCTIAVEKDPASSDKKPRFNIKAKNIELTNSSFSLNNATIPKKALLPVTGKAGVVPGFDVSHIRFDGINVKAGDIECSPVLYKARIKRITAHDPGGFYLSDLSTDIMMTDHALTAASVLLHTAHSTVDCSIKLNYPSLRSLRDSLQSVHGSADIKTASGATMFIISSRK
jgi:hypothetical protein